MADKAHRLTDEKLEEMEKRLSAIYSRAEKEIGERWKEYLAEAQSEIDELQKAYDIAKKSGDPKEIRKAGIKLSKAKRNRTLMNNRFKDLTERTAAELANVNKTALAYINGQLPEVYSINYNVLAPTVDGVGGYSFALVDADTVRNLATTDKSLLPYKQLEEKKDIRWNVKKMNSEVLQGILQGEPMDRIASRLSKVIGMDETAAIRNARTMVTGAENKGRQDSYARAEADGIILQKEWLSTNDGRTRHSHAMLDGAIVDQDKKFENGLMYPGDPSGRPEEVYNCRCTLVAKVNGFKKAQVQKKYEDVHDLPQKPIRPKKKDYETEEEYLKAREKYKADKEEYEKKISDVVNSNLSKKRKHESVESLKNWAKSKGIKVDDSIGTVDVRAFDDYIGTTDKLFAKYPQVLQWYREQGYSYTLDTIGDAGTLASAGHGFSFGRLFSNYENVLHEYLEAITSGSQVRGDGTIAGLFRHEFGHELDTTIRMSMYGDLEKRKAYMSDIRSLYGKSGMSEYATVNEEEMFAEAFAEYESGSDSEFAKAFGELLGRWLK